MNFEPVQVVIFILIFVPGFIFVQTIDHHLQKGEKSQFEKTVQILLASTIIWVVVIILPLGLPGLSDRVFVMGLWKDYLGHKENSAALLLSNYHKMIYLYVVVCLYTFVSGNIWGIVRRGKTFDRAIRRVTGRDWYKTVALRFYDESINARVIVTKKDKRKYLGILNGAPDDIKDDHVIIVDPHFIENTTDGSKFVKLKAIGMLFDMKEVETIEVLPNREVGNHGLYNRFKAWYSS
jgi:hypothetical protein